ncbi:MULTISPECIES: hypothetical protein [unclassified Bradyrhizobium]|uniref:hypothetical protein n=1 Tax=unclassified Bradyrhizobium TaxID=2631580 RepID=UPI00291673C4|nr:MULTISPECIES: hypothetical protein [unclassified Bradyrhizobium]
MAGLLNILTGNSAAASPWGMLYPSPLLGPDPQRQAAYDAAVYGSLGLDPSAVLKPDPFGDPHKPSVADPSAPAKPASGFGSGAMPFSFAGPGSMIVQPSQIAGPAAPVQTPAPAQAAPNPSAPAPAAARPPAAARAPAAPMNIMPGGDQAAGSAPAAPAAPLSLGGAGLLDRLGAAGQSMQNSHGLIPKLFNGVSALATGERTDAAGQAANATSKALLAKGASPADVQAAMGNPGLMQALVNQFYGRDKFKVVQTGEDGSGRKAYSVFNEFDGTMKPLAGPASAEDSATVTGPDGKPIAIPAGVDRKEFVKRITEASADAATGKKTEAQAKAGSFAARMEQAEGALGGLQNEGLSMWGKGLDALPGGVGNLAQSPQYQKFNQAKSAFITALLRQESGAAIGKSEFDRYDKELFPQPGDGPDVVKQKAQMRASAIEQMRGAAGPGYRTSAPQSPAPSASGTVSIGGASIPWSVK